MLYLVYTHYHPDHTWGASIFSEAVVLACPETGRLLQHYSPSYLEHYRRNYPLIYDRLKDVEIVPPDSTIEDGARIDLGGVEVLLECAGPAHTAGDCIVAVPSERVLFAGGLVSNGYHPNLGDPDADMQNWLTALDMMEEEGYRHIIPGQGKVCGPEALESVSAYIMELTGRCREAIQQGVPFDRAVEQIVIAGTAGYEQANILPFNIRACYRREVIPTVRPPFELSLPDRFTVADGGGSTKKGRVLWVDAEGVMRVEILWEPTPMRRVIVQDIKDRLSRYLEGRLSVGMDIEGTERVTVGSEEALALHGSYREGSERVGIRAGLWTWAMLVEEGRVFLFRLHVIGGESSEDRLEKLKTLESLLETVEFH